MAFQMNYTTHQQANYPQSYWRIGSCQVDRNASQARVRLDCYFNQDARLGNLENNILEAKNYLITGDDFSEVFEQSEDIFAAIYSYAKNYKEGAAPAEGQPDTRASFFETAVEA